MQHQGKYKATLFISLWYSQFIGLTFGWWLATYAEKSGAVQSGLMPTAWFASMWYVWSRARRVFWPEDFKPGTL